MDDSKSKQKTKKLEIEKSIQSEKTSKRLKKVNKRKQKKKRAKARYYTLLQKKRLFRSTEELCDSVKLFDVTDMEWTPSLTLPNEVSEWQKQDQIAYWKSRAISLEIENRMLHKHIRDVYTKQIEDYQSMSQWTPVKATSKAIQEKPSPSSPGSSKTPDATEEIPEKVIPIPPDGKNRGEEMRKIYGDSSQKIMGMETAIQLNYERHTENSNLPYWPNLPLNFKMEN